MYALAAELSFARPVLGLTPEELVVHSSVQVLEKPAWTAPALAGSHLFLRGKGRLVALDIGAAAAEADRGR